MPAAHRVPCVRRVRMPRGRPSSDELKNEDMLRKAWDAEGSPFKGTPFDPSKINMGGGGGGSMPLPGMPPPSAEIEEIDE